MTAPELSEAELSEAELSEAELSDDSIPEVSILVAVYNAAHCLHFAIDSLRRQSMPHIQIICIDDHSTDNSLSCLQHYAQLDHRVEVIALPENLGQARARNIGLKQARGRYTCFLDADDALSSDALQQALHTFTLHPQTDCVLFDCQILETLTDDETYNHQHSSRYPMPEFDTLPGKTAFEWSLNWTIHGIYMVRTHLFKTHPYDETCRLYSDDNTTRIHYLLSREVRQCCGIYYYLRHATSMTNQVSVRRFDHLRANESMKRQMLDLKLSSDIIAKYENIRWLNLIDMYMFYYQHGKELSDADRHDGLQEMQRVWHTIDRRLLYKHTTIKFGYHPCSTWRIFTMQENLYFYLRTKLRR